MSPRKVSAADLTSIVGLVLGVLAVVGGQVLEGGSIKAIMQPTAAVIVFGGTIGAVCLSFPLSEVKGALRSFKLAFTEKKTDPDLVIKEILGFASKARKNGLISIENDLAGASSPFLAKVLRNAVDGMDPKLLAETVQNEIDNLEEARIGYTKVFEAAGGYSPTIGILGAVMGLIHVMENLSDPTKLGSGIAVAFVATLYGVGAANLMFLPWAGKLRIKIREKQVIQEMTLEAVLSIVEGV
ncbi:MAG: flagellar motor protein, partial [Nitrospirota bacterium]